MKISIAMATCNGAAFLHAQLASFSSQTRRPDELVITDDQSSDHTVAIAQDFANSAPYTVRIESNAHRLGITNNFSKALSLCTGELIMLSDQDDVWLPEKIATLENLAYSHPDKDCFINDALLADEMLNLSGASKLGQILASGLSQEAMVMGCCTSLRRDLLEILLPIPHDPQGFDGWLVHFSDLVDRTLRLNVPLQLYRRHGNNASNIFVNQIQPLSRYDVIRKRILDFPRRFSTTDGLNNEQEFFSLVANRMADRMATMEKLIGGESAMLIHASTDVRASLLAQRRKIRGELIGRRLPMIWTLFRNGGYRSSGNFAGALKDLLIRTKGT
jgi:glycosyltransferase involved in cell wall biosynthesis